MALVKTKADKEKVEEIHAYLDLALGMLAEKIGGHWTYEQVADLTDLSPSTIRNMHYHEDYYCPSSLTLAKLGAAAGLQLEFVKHRPKLKLFKVA